MTRSQLAACAIAATAAGFAVGSPKPPSGAHTRPAAVLPTALPAPVRPAFTPGPALPIPRVLYLAQRVPSLRAVAAHRRPITCAAPVDHDPTMTPDDTVN